MRPGGASRRPVPQAIGRRAVLGAAVGAAASACAGPVDAQAVPADDHLVFDIIRGGSRIGQESLTFKRAGDQLTVEVEAAVLVTMALIPVYRLHHRETEVWANGQILSFAATTVKNGTHFYAQGWRAAGGFMARGTARPVAYRAPAGALPTSQWNHRMLDGPMINTEDGNLMDPVVTDEGLVDVTLADGRAIRARHFRASGDLRFDTFFTGSWEWVGLSFRGPDGSLITYRKA